MARAAQLEAVFRKYGHGANVRFLLEQGAVLDDVPCGLPRLLEDTFRMYGLGANVHFLLRHCLPENWSEAACINVLRSLDTMNGIEDDLLDGLYASIRTESAILYVMTSTRKSRQVSRTFALARSEVFARKAQVESSGVFTKDLNLRNISESAAQHLCDLIQSTPHERERLTERVSWLDTTTQAEIYEAACIYAIPWVLAIFDDDEEEEEH